MAILEPGDPGAVDELAALGLEIVDQMAAVGGAGALLEVLQHLHAGDLALVLGGQPISGLQAHGTAAHHHDLAIGVGQLLGMGQQPGRLDVAGLLQAGNGRQTLLAAIGKHHGVVSGFLQLLVGHGDVQVHGDAILLLHLAEQPFHIVVQLILAQRSTGGVHLAAHTVGLFKHVHGMAPLCGGDGEVQARAACADNGDALAHLGRGGNGRQQLLEAGAGIHGALGMAALDKLVDAALLAADAGTDVLHLTGVGLVAPVGIGQHRTASMIMSHLPSRRACSARSG